MARILVLEDSMLSRRMVSRILKAADYEVVEVADGKSGLAIITTQVFDCILLDLLMPEMDGKTVLENVRQKKLSVPIIVITADIQESTRQQCLELGAFAVLSKPINSKELLHTLKLAINPNMSTS